MSVIRNGAAVACATAALGLLLTHTPTAQEGGTLAAIMPGSPQALRAWSERTDSMLRTGELRMRQVRDDTLITGHVVQRADQYYRGVRVHGADISRQLDEHGVVLSVFGNLYDGIDLTPDPELTPDEVRTRVSELAEAEQAESNQPELVVLPRDEGGFRLAWRMRAVTPQADIVQYFLDAASGDVLLQYSDRQSQSAVGRAVGVLGDTKKISVAAGSGGFLARDLLRPALIETEDMHGDPGRTLGYLVGAVTLGTADVARSPDNHWTDGPINDAHVYAGFTYDYYFKRFGLHGLDDHNIRTIILGNPVRRTAADLARYFQSFPDFFVNASYEGGGVVLYGVGLPPGFTLRGQTWNFTSAALDIVAHELSHGVTEFSSGLIYRNESGALNEAFSDIMATNVEFFFQPPGDGPQMADYELGEDAISGGGIRSLDNPGLHGDPDHYSKRYTGAADGGGIHTNVTIADHAFYLAIEGGTNRTSGLAVQGVGGGNREQIEKVFYRAFTQMLPSNATFSVARAATIQAARDLYGANSAAERAVTQAWTAVGVN
jgi:thermolysin